MTTYTAPNAGDVGGTGTFPKAVNGKGKSVGYVEADTGAFHGYRLNVPEAQP